MQAGLPHRTRCRPLIIHLAPKASTGQLSIRPPPPRAARRPPPPPAAPRRLRPSRLPSPRPHRPTPPLPVPFLSADLPPPAGPPAPVPTRCTGLSAAKRAARAARLAASSSRPVESSPRVDPRPAGLFQTNPPYVPGAEGFPAERTCDTSQGTALLLCTPTRYTVISYMPTPGRPVPAFSSPPRIPHRAPPCV